MTSIDVPQAEAGAIAEYLNQLEPGFLPLPIFHAIARLVTTPTLELVIVRVHDGKPEVLLVRRPDDDPHWSGQWHSPGTVLRSTDAKDIPKAAKQPGAMFSEPVRRILSGELSGQLRPLGDMQYVTTNFWKVERGTEFSPVYYIEVAYDGDDEAKPGNEASQVGQFFPLDELPVETVSHHKLILADVAKAFKL